MLKKSSISERINSNISNLEEPDINNSKRKRLRICFQEPITFGTLAFPVPFAINSCTL